MQNETPVEARHSARQSASVHYESNPFLSAKDSITRLFQTNSQTLIGVALFNVLLFVLVGMSAVAIFLALVGFAVKHWNTNDLPAPLNSLDVFGGMNDMGFIGTWVVGGVLLLFFVLLMQSIQLRFTLVAARGESLQFGALLKQAIRLVLPLLGLVFVALGACIVAAVALTLLANVLGIIAFVVGVIFVIGAMYVSLRLAFTSYHLAELTCGPIEAIKRSWRLTQGHLIETLGSGSVTWLIFVIPSLILTALAKVAEGSAVLANIFGLLDVLLVIPLIFIAAMPLADRFIQLRAVNEGKAVASKLSPMNYLAIVLVIVIAPLYGALSGGADSSAPGDWSSPHYTSPTQDSQTDSSSDFQPDTPSSGDLDTSLN